MLNCWCSGTRTRSCAVTSAGSGTSQQTGCGSPRWHGSSPAGAGPRSSRLRPRRCCPGTANWRGESTTRAGGASPAVRRQSRASPAWSFGWRRRIMSATVRSWRLHGRTGCTMGQLTRDINPVVRGWIQYYGAFGLKELVSSPSAHQLLPGALAPQEVPAAARLEETPPVLGESPASTRRCSRTGAR
jgi:Group II intron, maturase-specific domain